MNGCAIPDNQQLAWNMALQVLEEFDHLSPFDAAGVNLEVKAPQHHPANDRKTLPVKSLLQQRGLASRSPGPHPGRPCAQTAIIHKNNQPALPPRFFFNAGHFTRFHSLMAVSSRSIARRSG